MNFLIGEHINKVLSGSSEVKNIFGNRTFAGFADNTTMPYLVYRRTGGEVIITKDGIIGDNVFVEIAIYAEDYSTSVHGADAISKALVNKRGSYDTFDVVQCTLTPFGEDLSSDDMAQILNFSFKTKNK